jgi:hypothetical protein
MQRPDYTLSQLISKQEQEQNLIATMNDLRQVQGEEPNGPRVPEPGGYCPSCNSCWCSCRNPRGN